MAGNQQEGEQAVENENGAGKTCKPIAEQQQADDDRGGEERDHQNVDNVVEARVAPHAPVESEDIEGRNFDAEDEREQAGELPQGLVVQIQFKTSRIGQILRQYDQSDIETKDKPEFGIFHQVSEQSALHEYLVNTGRIHKSFSWKFLYCFASKPPLATSFLEQVDHTIFS